MADYRKMWEELGMDLETHDQLCEVLPQAFGDVYLSQENRPEGMDYYNMVVADIHGIRPAELIEHQKKGGKVFGTFCVYVPDEIVFAADGIATGLCGGSQFWVPGGEKVLPTNTCPLIKASVGARLDRTCPFFPDRGYLCGRDYLRWKEESLGDSGRGRSGLCDEPSSDEAGERRAGMGGRDRGFQR